MSKVWFIVVVVLLLLQQFQISLLHMEVNNLWSYVKLQRNSVDEDLRGLGYHLTELDAEIGQVETIFVNTYEALRLHQ